LGRHAARGADNTLKKTFNKTGKNVVYVFLWAEKFEKYKWCSYSTKEI
jgi:hypothetical protein